MDGRGKGNEGILWMEGGGAVRGYCGWKGRGREGVWSRRMEGGGGVDREEEGEGAGRGCRLGGWKGEGQGGGVDWEDGRGRGREGV